MSTTDAITITSAPDALTRYYDAKEREESAALYINDAYLEALNSLEKLEAENAKLRELVASIWCVMWACAEQRCPHRKSGCYRVNGNGGTQKAQNGECWYERRISELGIEVPDGS